MNWPPFFGVSRGVRAWIMSAIVRVLGGHSFRWQCKQYQRGTMCQRLHGHPGSHVNSDDHKWNTP